MEISVPLLQAHTMALKYLIWAHYQINTFHLIARQLLLASPMSAEGPKFLCKKRKYLNEWESTIFEAREHELHLP